MRMSKRSWILVVSLVVPLLAVASPARAALIDIVADADTLAFVSPANNDVFGAGVVGSIGASLVLTQRAQVTFTFLGFEAGYTNFFDVAGATVFVNKTAAVGATAVFVLDPGLMDFRFVVDNTGAIVTNAGNDGGAAENIFIARLGDGEVIVALDDSGAGPDDNHDDHVIRISAIAAPIPEPASLGLYAIGVAAVLLGVARRRA